MDHGVKKQLTLLAMTIQLVVSLPALAEGLLDERAWITNMPVEAIVSSGNTVYIGGLFTYVGPKNGFGQPVQANNGALVPGFPLVDGPVYASIPDGRGGWYIGGDFTHVGGAFHNRLAHIFANGTADPNWNPSMDGPVYALALSPNGTNLYVGGAITHSLLIVSTRTGVAAPFGSVDGIIHAIAIGWETGNIYAGGDTDELASCKLAGPCRYITAWRSDGAQAPGWKNPRLGEEDPLYGYITGPVHAIAIGRIGGHEAIYAGGGPLDTWAGSSVLALDTTGHLIPGWKFKFDGNEINALLLSEDKTTLYAGGNIVNNTGGPVDNNESGYNSIFALSAATGDINKIIGEIDCGIGVGDVRTLALVGTNLYAGGEFVCADTNHHKKQPIGAFPDDYLRGPLRNNIAVFDAATGLLQNWSPHAMRQVRTLSVSGPNVYVGGGMETDLITSPAFSIGGVGRNMVAAIDGRDGAATGWSPNDIHDGAYPFQQAVTAMALSDDGKTLYAGGIFNRMGGTQRTNLAAIDTATGGIKDWYSTNSLNFSVFNVQTLVQPNVLGIDAMAVHGERVYVATRLKGDGAALSYPLAALDATSAEPRWQINPDNSVRSLIVRGDNLLAGGEFCSIANQNGVVERRGLAALKEATGNTTPWNPTVAGGDFDISCRNKGIVLSLLTRGNTLYVGGRFTGIGGQNRNGIAQMDITDLNRVTVDNWNPDLSAAIPDVSGTQVYSLSLLGPYLYIGGTLGLRTGNTLNKMMAIDLVKATAASWESANPNFDRYDFSRNSLTPNSVSALAVNGQNIYAGGEFTEIEGKVHPYFAKLVPAAPTADDCGNGLPDPGEMCDPKIDPVNCNADCTCGIPLNSCGACAPEPEKEGGCTHPSLTAAAETVPAAGTDRFSGKIAGVGCNLSQDDETLTPRSKMSCAIFVLLGLFLGVIRLYRSASIT